MIGSALAHYQVTGRLGAGGLGEVYRARDTKLERDVAIRVLPADWSDDPERLARFEREAAVLASLSHPNIATVHGLDAAGGVRFIVLELVEGDTLAALLRRGLLPIERALEIGLQIAEALEAAHDEGIVHRDLKPSSVKITPSGTVKVLDFGLARAIGRSVPTPVEDIDGPSALDPDWSGDLPLATTREGVVVGTLSYMSPEQACGGQVDRRSDVWSFGCLLFECLTGTRPFGGDASDAIGAAFQKEPEWRRLPESLSPSVKTLLRRSLERDPRRRLQRIGDARTELSGTRGCASPAAQGASRGRSGAKLPWIIAVVALVIAVVALAIAALSLART